MTLPPRTPDPQQARLPGAEEGFFAESCGPCWAWASAGPLPASVRPREAAAAERVEEEDVVGEVERAIELDPLASAVLAMARAQAPTRTPLS